MVIVTSFTAVCKFNKIIICIHIQLVSLLWYFTSIGTDTRYLYWYRIFTFFLLFTFINVFLGRMLSFYQHQNHKSSHIFTHWTFKSNVKLTKKTSFYQPDWREETDATRHFSQRQEFSHFVYPSSFTSSSKEQQQR